MIINGETMLVSNLSYAKLPQDFLLLPILYFFFNLDLVCNIINKNKRIIVFIDDYTVQITSFSITKNLPILQTKIISHLKSQVLFSKTIFQAKKIYKIHFTQNKNRILKAKANILLIIKNQKIYAFQKIKIFDVILDFEVHYSNYITQVCKQGINAVVILKQLKNLRLEAIQQLYISILILIIDYAFVILAPNAIKGVLARLNTI